MNLVFTPLKETLVFWFRNFVPVAIITFILVVPEKILFWEFLLNRNPAGKVGWIAQGFADLLLQTVQQSALLGLLLFSAQTISKLEAIRRGIREGWWKFLILNSLSAAVFAVIVDDLVDVLLHKPFLIGLIKPMMVLVGLVSAFAFAKLGPALPTILLEQTSVEKALRRSWILASGGYAWMGVIGYYVIYLFTSNVSRFTRISLSEGMPSMGHIVIIGWIQGFVASLFVVFLGCYYRTLTSLHAEWEINHGKIMRILQANSKAS